MQIGLDNFFFLSRTFIVDFSWIAAMSVGRKLTGREIGSPKVGNIGISKTKTSNVPLEEVEFDSTPLASKMFGKSDFDSSCGTRRILSSSSCILVIISSKVSVYSREEMH